MCHFIISVSASERSLQIPISFRVPLKIERSNSWVSVAHMMHSWWKKRMKPWIYPLWFLSESAVGTSSVSPMWSLVLTWPSYFGKRRNGRSLQGTPAGGTISSFQSRVGLGTTLNEWLHVPASLPGGDVAWLWRSPPTVWTVSGKPSVW